MEPSPLFRPVNKIPPFRCVNGKITVEIPAKVCWATNPLLAKPVQMAQGVPVVSFKLSPRAFQIVTFFVFIGAILALVAVIWLGPQAGTAHP